LKRGTQINLDGGLGENDGAGIPPLHHHPALGADGPLFADESPPKPRNHSYMAGSLGNLGPTDRLGDILSV